MNQKEQELADKILARAVATEVHTDRYNALINYGLLVSASKNRAESELVQIHTIELVNEWPDPEEESCEICGEPL